MQIIIILVENSGHDRFSKIKSKQLTNKLELHLNTENIARGAVKPAGFREGFSTYGVATA
jgi:hypothetical protein